MSTIATKTLASFAPFADFNQASFTPGKFLSPLVAQNRTYTRYEVRINEAEFDSIVDHGWFTRDLLPTLEAPAHFNVGSIAVKAAWRILTDADSPAVRSRYYVVTGAQVVDVAKSLAAGKPVCAKHDVALVGLHIAIKTKYRPQWLWSTFEHVDNVPPVGVGEAREPDAKDANAPYSYNDPAKEQAEIAPPVDSPLAQPVGPGNPPRIDPEPMQVDPQASHPSRDHGDEPGLLVAAGNPRDRLGPLHAGRDAMADGDAAARARERRPIFSRPAHRSEHARPSPIRSRRRKASRTRISST